MATGWERRKEILIACLRLHANATLHGVMGLLDGKGGVLAASRTTEGCTNAAWCIILSSRCIYHLHTTMCIYTYALCHVYSRIRNQLQSVMAIVLP